MGVAYDVSDAGESGEFFGRTLGVAAGDDDFCSGILSVEFADGVAGLGVGGGRDGTSIEHDDFGGMGVWAGRVAEVNELAFEGGAVGLRGPAPELLNVEGGHVDWNVEFLAVTEYS